MCLEHNEDATIEFRNGKRHFYKEIYDDGTPGHQYRDEKYVKGKAYHALNQYGGRIKKRKVYDREIVHAGIHVFLTLPRRWTVNPDKKIIVVECLKKDLLAWNLDQAVFTKVKYVSDVSWDRVIRKSRKAA